MGFGFFGLFDALECLTDLFKDDVEDMKDVDIEDFMKPEVRYDVDGRDAVIVSGNPEAAAPYLDYFQGDEVEGATGTCGLTSISNICRLGGMDVTERDVVNYALDNGLCNVDPWSPSDTGGTNETNVVAILDHYGIDAHWAYASECSDESIAQAVESGRGVMVGLSAGAIWGESAYIQSLNGQLVADHFVTVTGVVRDAETGEVTGYYICDSGRGLESDACRYVEVDLFHASCTNAYTGSVVITDDPIRVI